MKPHHKHWDWALTKNKTLEIDVSVDKEWFTYFHFSIGWNRHCDHAGLRFSINLAWFDFDFDLHDNRHWDYDKKCYYSYSTGVYL